MTVIAGFTHRHTPQQVPDLSALTLSAPAVLAAAELVRDARSVLAYARAIEHDIADLSRRSLARRDAEMAVALAEQEYDAAVPALERAVRAANPTAPEAAIQAATRTY